MEQNPIIRITKDDCEWSYTRGSGAGGQKRNKTSSAVHCIHKPSGAHGYSEAGRSQLQNRRDAFLKMANSPLFQAWIRTETAKRLGESKIIDDIVNEQMRSQFIRLEIKDSAGKWTSLQNLPTE